MFFAVDTLDNLFILYSSPSASFSFNHFHCFIKPMKLKAAMELDIICCGYSRHLVHSIFFTIGIPTLVT